MQTRPKPMIRVNIASTKVRVTEKDKPLLQVVFLPAGLRLIELGDNIRKNKLNTILQNNGPILCQEHARQGRNEDLPQIVWRRLGGSVGSLIRCWGRKRTLAGKRVVSQ